MFQIQSGIQQVPFVSTFIIISNFSNILCPVFFSFYFTGVFIGISSLVGIFIIDGKIQFQISFGSQIARILPPNSSSVSIRLPVRLFLKKPPLC